MRESFRIRILKQEACKKLRGGQGGATYEPTSMQEVVEGHWRGSVDIETRRMQEVAERLGVKYRY